MLFSLAILLAGTWLLLTNAYARESPRVPQPETDQVYRLNNHGTVVYLTKQQDSVLFYLPVLAMVCGVVGGILSMRSGDSSRHQSR